jgi:spore maturation protein CgeB
MSKDTIYIDFSWFKDLKLRLKIFFNLSYSSMNYRYSKEWDLRLNQLMNEHNFTRISDHSAYLGDTELWISNHPYASFVEMGETFLIRDDQRVRASRLTIYKAHKKLEQDKLIPENIRGRYTYSYSGAVSNGSMATGVITSESVVSGGYMGTNGLGNGIPDNWENEL